MKISAKEIVTIEHERYKERLQNRLILVLNELHDANFVSVLVESQDIQPGSYFVKFIIDREGMSAEDVALLLVIAKATGCTLALVNRHGVSRLALWLRTEDEAKDA